MLLGGDEIRRTQNGNNNAYNQDNPTSWFDWSWSSSNQRDAAFRPADDRVPESASGALAAVVLHRREHQRRGSPISRGTARRSTVPDSTTRRRGRSRARSRVRWHGGPARHDEHVLGGARFRSARRREPGSSPSTHSQKVRATSPIPAGKAVDRSSVPGAGPKHHGPRALGRPQISPAPRAHLYFAPSTATGISVE